MKFSCTQENLLQTLSLVSRVASRAGNLPILSHIHLKVEADAIYFKATNLEIGITCALRGKIDALGEFTVPAKLFTDYIAFLPKERVDITLEDNNLKVICGKHVTAFKGLPAADFPLIPPIEDAAMWRVSLPALLEGLEQVAFSISPTETRPEISGALFSFQDKKLVIAGTDSYRLAEKALTAESEGGKDLQVIVPLRSLQELIRICAHAKEEVGTATLLVSQNQLAMKLPTLEFVSRLVDGQYPDYRAIIPSRFGTQALIKRDEFVGAIKAAGLFSKAGIYDVGVELNPQGGATITALNSQTGEHTSVLDAEIKGAAAKIAFNWKYLLEGAQALRNETILIKATDSAAPTLLSELQGGDYFYIVMPIKE